MLSNKTDGFNLILINYFKILSHFLFFKGGTMLLW